MQSSSLKSRILNQSIFWSFWYTIVSLPFSFSTPQSYIDHLNSIFNAGFTVINLGVANLIFSAAGLWGLWTWSKKRDYQLRPWNSKLMGRFLFWISGKLPCRIISDGKSPYLERYHLFGVFGVRFYLHRFVDSDPDRGFHDHPWKWAKALVLLGRYTEITPHGEKVISVWNSLKGDNYHRVILDRDPKGNPKECWTIFFHQDKYVKNWGFLSPSKTNPTSLTWLPWDFDPQDPSKDGSATSGQWWLSAPSGSLCRDRARQKEFLS